MKRLLSSLWFKLALSVVLLGILVHETDFSELRHALFQVRPGWLVLAFVAYVSSQVISAVRWWLLARPLGFNQPFQRFFACYFSGMYLNLFAPSTVAGDIGRALFLAGGKRRTLALTSVIADRGIGFVALVWIGAAAILLLPGYPLPRPLYWSAWLIPPASLVAWWAGPLALMRVLPVGHRLRVMVERDLEPYRKDHRLLAVSFAIACGFHLIQIGTQIFIAWAMGLNVPPSFFLIFVPVVNIAGMLPISLNGVGVREAGYWYFLSLIAVDRESAIVLGLLSSGVVLTSALTGAPAFLFLRHGRKSEAAVAEVDEMVAEAPLPPAKLRR